MNKRFFYDPQRIGLDPETFKDYTVVSGLQTIKITEEELDRILKEASDAKFNNPSGTAYDLFLF